MPHLRGPAVGPRALWPQDQPAGGTPARNGNGNGNGNGKGAPAQPAQQFRGPSSFATWDDDFTFDEWTQPLSPGGGGGYGGGSGGGGYMQNGGYMQDSKGYGNYGGYGGYGNYGGYGGTYIGGGNGGYMGGSYMQQQTSRRRNGRQLAFDEYDEYDDLGRFWDLRHGAWGGGVEWWRLLLLGVGCGFR